MKNKLITALRTTANALESGLFHYDWDEQSTCNCGALASCILGVSPAILKPKLKELAQDTHRRTWTDIVGMHCPLTGIPENEILKALFAAGMSAQDIHHLEYLSDPQVLARMPRKTQIVSKKRFLRQPIKAEVEVKRSHKSSADAAAYMRAWADLLVEQGRQDSATPTSTETKTQITQ